MRTKATPAGILRALERRLLVEVNRARAARGLASLRVSFPLTAAALSHAEQMARKGYFAHASPGGLASSQRIEHFYSSRGYRSGMVGENLLWASPDVIASGAVAMWLRSPEHRANLLSRTFREIGLAAVHVASGPGAFANRETTIVTADFG